MRPTRHLIACVLMASMLASSAHAADLPWGRNGIAPHPRNLGPIGEGRRVWLKLNCYGCHGNNAGGGMGPNIRGAESGDISEAVLGGDASEGGMRSFAKYATKTDVANLAAYLGSIGTKNEPTWLDWWNANPGAK